MGKGNSKKWINYGMFSYIVLFTLYSFVGRILPLYLLIGEKINGYIFILFASMGSVLVVLDFLNEKWLFKGQYCAILYLFIGIMILSSIVNIKYGYMDNLKTIVWQVIQIAIFFSAYTRIGKEKMFQFLKVYFSMVGWIWTIAVVYSLKQFVVLDSYSVELWEGHFRFQGFSGRRLYGVFNDPNFAAVTSLYVIYMFIFLAHCTKKKIIKLIYYSVSMLNVLYIILSGSRTALVCATVSVVIFLIMWLKNYFIGDKKAVRFLKRLFVILALIYMCVCAWWGLNKVLPYIPDIYMKNIIEKNQMEEQKVAEAQETKNEIESDGESQKLLEEKSKLEKAQQVITYDKDTYLKRPDVVKENISNNRIQIWRNYLKGIKGSYFLGASPRNIEKYMEENNPEIFEQNNGYETHNGFVSLFAGTGIVGSIIIFIYMMLVGKDVIKVYLNNKIDWEFASLFTIICIIIIYSCFFTELFFVNNLTTSLFWLLLGAVMYWLEEKKTKITGGC